MVILMMGVVYVEVGVLVAVGVPPLLHPVSLSLLLLESLTDWASVESKMNFLRGEVCD